ncbi:MAG: UDP-N-acetylmuramoyl-tripeptide--D-alanyl-D-alanine ligase [Acidimicrobiia bacterium]|nr:UDP-N-acetylmuramoyl-tripeptide--D-alanyl-D-alanine ligase [Acidimicrobiia bacterium]
MTAFLLLVATGSAVAGALRWLRVAQREHYLAWSVTPFARRWWLVDGPNAALLSVAVVAAILGATGLEPGWVWVLLACGVAVIGPRGLGMKGRTAPLAWTSRLRRLGAAAAGAWLLAAGGAVWVLGPGWLAVTLLAVPALVDVALAFMWPYEMRSGRQWVDQARLVLDQVQPTVVAITGSYGKTTTKEYVKRLLSVHHHTVASPASFNNRMGLARAINEHLVPGTEFFIAEMGTYGPGEIADLVSWIPPRVGVITAIGPVHLERFGSLDRIVEAKSEILAGVEVAVLNVDEPLLAALADRLDVSRVIRCSTTDENADVLVRESATGLEVVVGGETVTVVPPLKLASNLACAIGVAVGLGLPVEEAGVALADAATPQHRQSVYRSDAGFQIVDDTYNSNPAGAASALATLASLTDGRRVVVTPGMVELGTEQAGANRTFARQVSEVADTLVIVGRTNLRALRQGASDAGLAVIVVPSRSEAVDWVKSSLGPNDAVLYENDLPDHYP